MKKLIYKVIYTALFLVSISSNLVFADKPYKYIPQSLAPVSNVFIQTNNINSVFRSDGIFNLDKITFSSSTAGFIWPVSAPLRLTADFSTGLWIGTKVGAQRELRTAVCLYNSTFSPGNIPVIGQVPPSSVCSDPGWRGYLVNLTDPNLINGGTVTKTAGSHDYTITYDAWSNWPVNKGAPYVEVNGVPGYQPGVNSDRPGIGETTARPDEISFMVYMDYTGCTNNLHTAEVSLPGGTLPMGVEIQQITFAYNEIGLRDMYFMKWKIINKSSNIWDSTYISIVDDADIGDGSDDAAGCDSVRQTGFIYNGDNNDVLYGTAPPTVGYRLLQGPLKYTGNNLDTARLPYGNFVGYKLLGMTGYNVFSNISDPCIGDPDNAAAGYNYMRGMDGCGNTLRNPITHIPTTCMYSNANYCTGSRLGWFDTIPTDRRQIISSGPITMNSGDQQILLTAVMVARSSSNVLSVCSLLALSDSAKRYYDQSFFGTPTAVQNISTEIPKQFNLYQNYPNPFNPTTKIKFDIPVGTRRGVFLKIYDVLGREIQTLVNEKLNPGTYEVDFNGDNLPSGVYFYKLVVGDNTTSGGYYTQTKKMVLLK
jgi:hypothetical protein